jgi:hypothetical protein
MIFENIGFFIIEINYVFEMTKSKKITKPRKNTKKIGGNP